VLAADRRMLEQAILGHHKNYIGGLRPDEARHFAREYLEKIVHIPFDLPPLAASQLDHLLDA
jgi:hypothetical protein